MAELTRHVAVGSGQLVIGVPVVIEAGRGPSDYPVAAGAATGCLTRGELPAMNVFVAPAASLRGALVEHALDAEAGGCRLVTVRAGYSAVRPRQLERGCGMVEACKIVPGPESVAGLASLWSLAGPHHNHALAELAFMRILVTGRAGVVR